MSLALIGLGLLALGVVDGAAPAPIRETLAVRLIPGPYLVGQGVALELTLAPFATGAVAEVEPPRLGPAGLLPIGREIPSAGQEQPRVVGRFLLVPHQPGKLTIPPFRVHLGDRVVASKPTTLTVATVPVTGRARAFLGGVGSFRLASRVEPDRVRVGQPVDYRITMTGPAAAGSAGPLDLTALPAAIEVREATSRLEPGDPTTRTFRYRLRPMKAGRVTLPPVALAAFDPDTQRYFTRFAPSLVIAVEAPPRFDAARVDFGPTADSGVNRPTRWAVTIGLGAGLTAGAIGWRRWRRRRALPPGWSRQAAELARWASRERRAVDVAAEVVERLARSLERSTGRAVAVLTPGDAAAAVAAVTDDRGLSNRARELVAECDRICFDPEADATAGDLGELVAEAVAVFQAIGHSARPHQRGHRSDFRNPI